MMSDKIPCEVERHSMMLDVKGKVTEETSKIRDDDLRIGNSVVENKRGRGEVSFIRGRIEFGTKVVKVTKTRKNKATRRSRTRIFGIQRRQGKRKNEEEAEEKDKFEFLLLLLLQREFWVPCAIFVETQDHYWWYQKCVSTVSTKNAVGEKK